jgi:PHD/YefM family antitoxin component YafN of YafNO toxin-antitoxin module
MLGGTVMIITKDGKAIAIGEETKNILPETLYLSSIPKMKKEIMEGKNTPLEDCISEDKVKW